MLIMTCIFCLLGLTSDWGRNHYFFAPAYVHYTFLCTNIQLCFFSTSILLTPTHAHTWIPLPLGCLQIVWQNLKLVFHFRVGGFCSINHTEGGGANQPLFSLPCNFFLRPFFRGEIWQTERSAFHALIWPPAWPLSSPHVFIALLLPPPPSNH